jgi:hypothetical protein
MVRRPASPDHNFLGNKMPNTSNDPVFKAFSGFSTDDMPPEAAVSRRTLRQLGDIDKSTTPGPATSAARAALASSVVAHAVVELETELIALKKQLLQAK